MKTKRIIIILFVIVAIIQLTIPANMIYQHEKILRSGTQLKFKIEPIDPSDPFRGQYLEIKFDQDTIHIARINDWNSGEDIYVQFKVDSTKGFAHIVKISREKPQSQNDYVKAKVGYVYDQTLRIKYPFEKFYMDEFKAPKAERAYSKLTQHTATDCYAIVNVIDGEAVLNDVVLNGKSIREIK